MSASGSRPWRSPARRRRRLPVAAVLLWAGAGCDDDPIGSPLSLTIDAPSEAAPGQSVSVGYDAAGRRLLGIVFSWGDGTVDSVATAGAQTAAGSVDHVYEAPGGLFTIRARAEDAEEGVKVAEADIVVRRASSDPRRRRPGGAMVGVAY